MTQEEKQLLLKSLCARLPYGVKCGILTHPSCRLSNWRKENDLLYKGRPIWYKLYIKTLAANPIDCFYPYLRPLSSMTDKEKNEFAHICPSIVDDNTIYGFDCNDFEQFSMVENFLLKHHFDYRGLIEKGLALEAPADMYKED